MLRMMRCGTARTVRFYRLLPPCQQREKHRGRRKLRDRDRSSDGSSRSVRRRRGERADSLTPEIAAEREAHLQRISDDEQLFNHALFQDARKYEITPDKFGGEPHFASVTAAAPAQTLAGALQTAMSAVQQTKVGRYKGWSSPKRRAAALQTRSLRGQKRGGKVTASGLARKLTRTVVRNELVWSSASASRSALPFLDLSGRIWVGSHRTAGATGKAVPTLLHPQGHDQAQGHQTLPPLLPEIAIIGHSNSGKSSLVNVLAGQNPMHGSAGVSARAGWTSSIDYYRLTLRLPPAVAGISLQADEDGVGACGDMKGHEQKGVGALASEDFSMVLVDLPGYGHAVASAKTRQRWWAATSNYFRCRGAEWSQHCSKTIAAAPHLVPGTTRTLAPTSSPVPRSPLRMVLVLVDCARGLSELDIKLLHMLADMQCPHRLVVTKADQLKPQELARCNVLMQADAALALSARKSAAGARTNADIVGVPGPLPMVSALHLQGIDDLFENVILHALTYKCE